MNWSYYYELLKIEYDLERQFYENQSCLDNWSIRELRRQIHSGLFQRLALSKYKKGVIQKKWVSAQTEKVFVKIGL